MLIDVRSELWSLKIPHEEWDVDQIRRELPFLALGMFGPPRRPDNPDFWAEPSREIKTALRIEGTGYMSDPQLATRNLQNAAERHGARFRFATTIVGVRTSGGRVQGVPVSSGEQILAPVVVNVAGPYSDVINRLAGLTGGMQIRTRRLRHEVHHVPAPGSAKPNGERMHISDGDLGIYFRSESGNNILVGSEDPPCDAKE
jgi:sarcosine oxidase subunit beta